MKEKEKEWSISLHLKVTTDLVYRISYLCHNLYLLVCVNRNKDHKLLLELAVKDKVMLESPLEVAPQGGGGDADRGWTDALSVMVSLVAVTKCVTS